MNGTIDAIGKGLEQNGYRDYQQAEQTIFSIGGLGVTEAVGIQRDTEGYIQEVSNFQFNNTPIGFCQVDNNTMAALELPTSAGKNQKLPRNSRQRNQKARNRQGRAYSYPQQVCRPAPHRDLRNQRRG